MQMVRDFLGKAANIASSKSQIQDHRTFRLGAVGIRNDGVVVSSRNGAAMDKCPSIHAEARLCNKLTQNATVFVARVLRDGTWANSKPCPRCQATLKAHKVTKVYYTISPGIYGLMHP